MKYDKQSLNDPRYRIVQDIFPSKMPGYVYLMVLSDSSTVLLSQYLHSFSAFLYDKSIINRRTNFMPIHTLVTDFMPPVTNNDPKFSVGDWVVIEGPNLYKGSLGLVVPFDSRLPHPHRSKSITVLTIPRIPKSVDEEKAVVNANFVPPSQPFLFTDAHRIAKLYELDEDPVWTWGEAGSPEWGRTITSQCPDGISCPMDHLKEFFFRGHIFQCGLVLLPLMESILQPSPSSFDTTWTSIFIRC